MPPAESIVNNVVTFSDGYAAAKQLATSNLDIDYIFTNGDDVAAGVWQYYMDHKRLLPKLIGQENQLSRFLLHIPKSITTLLKLAKKR